MSRYGHFACFDCRIGIWLGKAVFDANNDHVSYFHISDPLASRNWQRQTLSKVIWKFLADHAGHRLHVVVEGEPLDREFEDFVIIGQDTIGFPTFEEYLRDWPG